MRTTSTYTLIKSTILVFFTLFAASISYAQSPKKLVKEATKLNNAKQYADAIVKLDLALSLDASNAKGYAQRGLAHDKLKNTEAAAADYAVASSLDNKEEDYFFEAGRLHNDLLQHKEAVQFLARALKLDKNNYMAYHEKIEAHMALCDFYMALEESQNAIGKNKTAQNYFFRGLANDSLQNYKDAIDDYGKAIKKDKSLEEAYVGLGFTLVRTKDLDRAAEVCEELLVLNPENTGAYFCRSKVQFEKGHFNQAVLDLSIVTKLEPENINALMSRGALYQELNQHANAITDYNKILQIDDICLVGVRA